MRWIKWFSHWFGRSTKSLGSLSVGLRAALSGGAPGGWASDHREETAHNTGFNYIAVHAIAAQVAGATVTVFADADQAMLRRARRKCLAARAGTFARWKSTYGADDRETDPLPAYHPLVRLLKRPNPYESGANFRYRQAQQIRLTGTCLIWNVPSIAGPPCERFVIPTAMASPVAPTVDLPRGGWRISPVASRYTPVVDDGFVDCPSWYRILGQIIDARHVQLIRLPHAWYLDDGQSPLSAGAKWVDAGEAVDEARFHQLKNGIDPSIVWNLPPDVVPDQDEIDRVQAKISAKYGGPENVGRVIVAQNGTSITPLSATPKDMCFTEGFHDFKAAVLALHQTPPVAVGLQEPGAYAAYNASMKAWRHAAVQPLCDMLAESDTEYLAPHFGSGLTIEIESDTVDDAELLEQQLQNDLAAKVRTRNEWRAVRGMPPLPGPLGDELVGTENPPDTTKPASRFSPPGPGSSAANQRVSSKTKTDLTSPDLEANTDPPDQNSLLNGADHDLDLDRQAELIAEILYGVYGESALEELERFSGSDHKAFDPALHPRDEQGRFTLRGSLHAIEEAREAIRDVLIGSMRSREDQRVLQALRLLTVRQLEILHREHGVTAPPRLRSRLTESVVSRLFDSHRPFSVDRDEFESHKQTAGRGIEVYLQKPDELKRILGRSLNPDEWGQIVGAQPGAKVHVFPTGPIANLHTKIEIREVHPDYIAKRVIHSKSPRTIENVELEVRPGHTGGGLATRMLSEQVDSAWSLGFRRLTLHAAGEGEHLRAQSEHPYVGYIVWPKLGFDGSLEDWLVESLKSDEQHIRAVHDFEARFPGVKTIGQLMRRPGGPEWWRKYGGSLNLEFDLNPNNSASQWLSGRAARLQKQVTSPGTKSLQPVAASDPDEMRRRAWLLAQTDRHIFTRHEPGEHPDPLTQEDEEELDRLWQEIGREPEPLNESFTD